MSVFKEKEIIDLKLTKGDFVLYNGDSENYSLTTGWDKSCEAFVLYQKGALIVTNINKFGIEIGFHFSRFIKVLKHAAGTQLQLF